MTLSALSMQMKSLETELGVSLFDRSVRPPRLTPIGRTVTEHAIPLLQNEEKLLSVCKPSDTLTGHFRIGFITTAAVRLLPQFLAAARKAAPDATFEFETGLSKPLQDKVLNGQIDAAVVTDADGLPDALIGRLIREEPFVFAAHETLMQGGLNGLLKKHPFFHFMPDTGIGKLIASEMKEHDRPPKAATVVLDNLEAIMECVTNALGFTLLPEPDVDRYRSKHVRKVTSPQHSRRTLVLATLQNGTLAKHDAMLMQLLNGQSISNETSERLL